MKILDVVKPIISTIPDETMLFSIIGTKNIYFNKLIMENYINLYAFFENSTDKVIPRFEDYNNFANIDCIETFTVPENVFNCYNKYENSIIMNLLSNNYYVLCYVNTFFIKFYNNMNSYRSHYMMIYGFNESEKILFCKDFNGNIFTDFTVSFEELEESFTNYKLVPNYNTYKVSLTAIRINEQASPNVNYGKFHSKLTKFNNSILIDKEAYGLAAIKLLKSDLLRTEKHVCMRYLEWIEVTNYLKETARLMKLRVQFLSQHRSNYIDKTCILLSDDLVKKTTLLWAKVMKEKTKNNFSDNLFLNFMEQFDNINSIYTSFINLLCKNIEIYEAEIHI